MSARPCGNVSESKKIPLEEASILSGSVATPIHGIRTQGRAQGRRERRPSSGSGDWESMAQGLAVAMGARVIAVDIAEDKLEAARRFGAEATINSARSDFVFQRCGV